jgi:hypothetical protein
MLQARVKEQTAKVDFAAKKVPELGECFAVEAAAGRGASPFAADGPGFDAPAASPIKRQRPESHRPENEASDDNMGRRSALASPVVADLIRSPSPTPTCLHGLRRLLTLISEPCCQTA